MEKSLFADQDYITLWWLAETVDIIRKARQKELNQYGIFHKQAAVLFIIQAIGDKATPAEMSRWLLQEPHSISELVIRMEKRGLVVKAKDLDRKNQVRITITEKGREVYYQSIKRESIHGIMSSLSEEEHHQLRSLLQKLRDRTLEELGITYEPPFP